MDFWFWSFLFVGAAIVAAIFLTNQTDALQELPAFSKVYINSEEINAATFNDVLNITTEGMIITTVDEPNNQITFSLQEFNCPLLQVVTGIDEDGNLVCGL